MERDNMKNAMRLSRLDSRILAGFTVGLLEKLHPNDPHRVEMFIDRMVGGTAPRAPRRAGPYRRRMLTAIK